MSARDLRPAALLAAEGEHEPEFPAMRLQVNARDNCLMLVGMMTMLGASQSSFGELFYAMKDEPLECREEWAEIIKFLSSRNDEIGKVFDSIMEKMEAQ